MEDLLPYFERELGHLRRASREFAERYPKLASRLLLSGDSCDDPHIERLVQACALLNARVAKQLDDNYPALTEALLDALYPHYLRPLPSYAIAHAADGPGGTGTIARGTGATSAAIGRQRCHFRTVYPITITPVQLAQARFDAIIERAALIRYARGVTSSISITFTCKDGFEHAGAGTLRVYIDGDASLCAALQDCLFLRTATAYVEDPAALAWQQLPAPPIRQAGLDEDDAILPQEAGSHAAYRLLTEYFAYPEKFNFFDLDLAAIARVLPPGSTRATLHLALTGIGADSATARMLRTLSAANLLLGCTPVVNLFKHSASPITLTHTSADYDLLACTQNPRDFETYSVDSVHVLKSGKQEAKEFRPFYALRHGEGEGVQGHYWHLRRRPELADVCPGYETRIGFVDIDFDPTAEGTTTASIELTCSNRDLPTQLTDMELSLSGGSLGKAVRIRRKPSPTRRFQLGSGDQWRLVSHLVLNHRSFSNEGLPVLRELLTLYNVAQTTTAQRQIAGIVAMATCDTTAWLRHARGGSIVHGVQITLTIDEAAFAGSGLYVFGCVLERYFGMSVHVNSFTQLVLVSRQTGKELMRCLPRNGALTLA